jgi:hypothetical protein
MSNFDIALKKGELGENIVREYLEAKGWIVYQPITKDKAHYFDMLCTLQKEKGIAIDVKTKARLNKWNAQGIDKRHYQQYMNFINTTQVNFYLFFVDDKTGDVHCADIKNLSNPIYPNDKIIAWNLNDMNLMFKLSLEQIAALSIYDQRNYEFKPK